MSVNDQLMYTKPNPINVHVQSKSQPVTPDFGGNSDFDLNLNYNDFESWEPCWGYAVPPSWHAAVALQRAACVVQPAHHARTPHRHVSCMQ